jgi:hypothetical protein
VVVVVVVVHLQQSGDLVMEASGRVHHESVGRGSGGREDEDEDEIEVLLYIFFISIYLSICNYPSSCLQSLSCLSRRNERSGLHKREKVHVVGGRSDRHLVTLHTLGKENVLSAMVVYFGEHVL